MSEDDSKSSSRKDSQQPPKSANKEQSSQLRKQLARMEREQESERGKLITFLKEVIQTVEAGGQAHGMIVDYLNRVEQYQPERQRQQQRKLTNDTRRKQERRREAPENKGEGDEEEGIEGSMGEEWKDRALMNERKKGCSIQ